MPDVLSKGGSELKYTQKEAVERLENEIGQLKTTLQTTREQRQNYEKQIKEKEASKTKKEKWLAIVDAGATTAAAIGLSVINPLAIPVAVGGGIRLINEFFRKTKKEKEEEEEEEGEDDGLEVATMGAPSTY
jgi:hypothetical protein